MLLFCALFRRLLSLTFLVPFPLLGCRFIIIIVIALNITVAQERVHLAKAVFGEELVEVVLNPKAELDVFTCKPRSTLEMAPGIALNTTFVLALVIRITVP